MNKVQFTEYVSENQNDLQLVRDGEMSATELAEKYADVDELGGLTIEEAAEIIESLL